MTRLQQIENKMAGVKEALRNTRTEKEVLQLAETMRELIAEKEKLIKLKEEE